MNESRNDVSDPAAGKMPDAAELARWDAMRRGLVETMAAAGETSERQAARNALYAELEDKYPGQYAVVREVWDGARIVEPFLLAVAPDAMSAARALEALPPEVATNAVIEYLMPPNRAMA